MAEIFGFKKMEDFDKFEYLINKFLKECQLHIREFLKRNDGKN
jgi:hypothetical protein